MAKHMRSDNWFVVDQINVALKIIRFWIWKNAGKPLPLNETWNCKYILVHLMKVNLAEPRHWISLSGQLHAPAVLLAERTQKMLGGRHSLSGRCGEDNNLSPMPGIESSTVQPVA
jgi:hypothetical protein